MQGFRRGWTNVDEQQVSKNGPRWKLVGNAVTVGVSRWVAKRLASPGEAFSDEELWDRESSWPTAAWGADGKIWRVRISEYPFHEPYQHLLNVLSEHSAAPLSERALTGFWSRLNQGNLGRHPGFRESIEQQLTMERRLVI